MTPAQLQRALTGAAFVDRPGDAAFDENLRLLATPVATPEGTLVVVVGASVDEKWEALTALAVAEVLGLVGALLVSSFAGYLVAGFALRPVEALRQRAAEITAGELASTTGPPLPVPDVDDEIGRLARTLNDMLEGLRQAQAAELSALARERRFVAEASHQLRTPLSIVKGEVELAELESAESGRQAAALRSIGEETDRLARLTDQLLTLAAHDENQLPLRKQCVLVSDLLERVADRHRSRALSVGRSITVTAPVGLQMSVDELLLSSALDNLVDNALHHGRGPITLTGTATEDGVRLDVLDAGEKTLAADAFEPFRKGGSSRGVGLGLTIVQVVAQAHDGAVRSGPGSVISVTVPGSD